MQWSSAMPMSTYRECLHERLPSAATRRVQPLQLQEVVPSVYCRVWYSRFGFESEAKLQTRVICLVILVLSGIEAVSAQLSSIWAADDVRNHFAAFTAFV